MLQQLLQAISGPISNIAYTYPTGNAAGGPTVTPQGMFNKLLNVLSSGSYNSNPANFLGNYTNMQGQNFAPAAQAYVKSLNNYGNGVNINSNKASGREAFSPGAVISDLQMPPIPQTTSSSYSPFSQLAGINPLQGFAGQAGTNGAAPGAFGTNSFTQQGMFPGVNGFTQPTGGFGKLSTLLMPFISLIGLVKSLFGLRGIASSEQPMNVDRNSLDYTVSLGNYQQSQNTDGSFYEGGYWDEEAAGDNSFDSSKLEM